MNRVVTDTMAIILRLENRKLPSKTAYLFEQAEKNNIKIYIPTIVLAEIGYLSEKSRIDTNIFEVEAYCQRYSKIDVIGMTFASIKAAFSISDIPELHDRLIASIALALDLPLITNDATIVKSQYVRTVWE